MNTPYKNAGPGWQSIAPTALCAALVSGPVVIRTASDLRRYLASPYRSHVASATASATPTHATPDALDFINVRLHSVVTGRAPSAASVMLPGDSTGF